MAMGDNKLHSTSFNCTTYGASTKILTGRYLGLEIHALNWNLSSEFRPYEEMLPVNRMKWDRENFPFTSRLRTEVQFSKTHFYIEMDTRYVETRAHKINCFTLYGISTTCSHWFGCLLSTVGFTASNMSPLLL